MRKHLLTIAFLVAGSIYAAAQTNFSVPKAFVSKQRAVCLPSVRTAAQSKIVFSEDFSKFTAGSETLPDATDISGTQAEGYVINPDFMNQPGWFGKGIHQAGGACAIRIYEYQYEGYPEVYTSCGYISTPESEFFGDVKVTFRAKIFTGKGTLWVGLCDNNYGPVDEKVFTLTDEWQELSFMSDKGTFNAQNVIQFAPRDNSEILIDDIVIERAVTKTETPAVNPAVNISETEFVASWNPTSMAEKYRLNVFKKVDDPNHIAGTLTENFDAINVMDDGVTINTASPNYPEGWIIDVSSNGMQDMNCTDGMFGSAPRSIMLDEVGDIIETPVLPAPVKEIRFWVCPSSYDYEYEPSMFSVSIHNSADDSWIPISNMPNYYLQPYGIVYKFDNNQIGLGVDKVRLEYIQKGSKSVAFAIDDLEIDYETQKLNIPVLENIETADTFYVVKGIEPEFEHYYYVQALQGDLVSDPSYNVWVDGITGIKPVIDMPSNVSATGFDISWNKFYNAQNYVADLSRFISAKEDMKAVTVLEEGFDMITDGTPDMPGMDWNPRFDFGENAMCNTHWTADQAQWIEGMAGTRGTNTWTGIPGFISTPVISLDNAGGAFDVELTVYTLYDNDEIVVMVQKSLDENATIYKSFKCDGVMGSFSGKLHFDNGGMKNCHVSVMSMNGYPIFLDYIKISQDLQKGESLAAPYMIFNVPDNMLSVSDLPEGCDYGVEVTARGMKDYVYYTSEKSDMMVVYTSVPTAIDDAADNGLSVMAVEGGLRVAGMPEGCRTEVFTVDGRMVAVAEGTDAVFMLPEGVYVVKAGRMVVKAVVR